MNDDDRSRDTLGVFFDAAQRETPVVSDALMARVAADAVRVQRQTQTQNQIPASRAEQGWRQQLVNVLGGWRGMGALVAACAAGVWLGFAPPADWVDPVQIVMQTESDLEMFETEDLAFLLNAVEG